MRWLQAEASTGAADNSNQEVPEVPKKKTGKEMK
jgi:hypothetical protein